ncbi:hypothetical protein BLNAU_8967 [Blattamonas nauphoetae]|uniref:Uncharacterized protein n=1 Tax=Blattamonas nauphoetae TaxID=2049346 RepID=A0ABQ9XWZ1_9EUKA|nr:hypothetical protein BLNAU_8967 [Blattamonas nauphoetae]
MISLITLFIASHCFLNPDPIIQQTTEIFVDPTGSDSNPGTPTEPLATLSSALKRVQELDTYADIYLSSGLHTLTPCTLTNANITLIGVDGATIIPALDVEEPYLFILENSTLKMAKLNVEIPEQRTSVTFRLIASETVLAQVHFAGVPDKDTILPFSYLVGPSIFDIEDGSMIVDSCTFFGLVFGVFPEQNSIFEVSGQTELIVSDTTFQNIVKVTRGRILDYAPTHTVERVLSDPIEGWELYNDDQQEEKQEEEKPEEEQPEEEEEEEFKRMMFVFQGCKFLDLAPAVLGGGHFHLDEMVGNGTLAFADCEFDGFHAEKDEEEEEEEDDEFRHDERPRVHRKLNGGMIFRHVQNCMNDTECEDDQFIPFPILPPDTEPAEGWTRSDQLDLNRPVPFFENFVTTGAPSLWKGREEEEDDDDDCIFDDLADVMFPPCLVSFEMHPTEAPNPFYKHNISEPLEEQSDHKRQHPHPHPHPPPSRIPERNNSTSNEEGEEKEKKYLRGAMEGHVFHVSTDPGLPEDSMRPQSVQHVYVKFWEEVNTDEQLDGADLTLDDATYAFRHQDRIMMIVE